MNEALNITKMQLPTQSSKFTKIEWNGINQYNFYERLKLRTALTRKEVIQKIIKAIDSVEFETDGPYIIKFTKSEFYVSVFVKLKQKYIQVKTILSYDMRLRSQDRVFPIQEVEKYFNFDLREFYEDGFINSYYGNLLIEEAVDRKSLLVQIYYKEGE